MTVNISYFAGSGWQFFADSGAALAGGKIYTYLAGTTTPVATYTTSAGTVANSNPIILDAAGRVPNQIWLTAGSAYKFVVKTSADVTIGTYDNLIGVADTSTLLASPSAIGSTTPAAGTFTTLTANTALRSANGLSIGSSYQNTITKDASDFFVARNSTQQYTTWQVLSPTQTALTDYRAARLLLARQDNSSNSEYLEVYNDYTASLTQYGIRIQKRGSGAYRAFVVDQYDGSTATPLMYIGTDGKVGVGTNSPGTKLAIAGGAATPSVAVAFSATAMTVDCTLSNVFTTTFTANVTTAPTISNPADGQTINWFITQDASGSRTMTWPASFKWPGGTAGVLSTGANSVDLVVATYRASTGFWYASLAKAFS
jgi:hypothetical protein